MALLSLLIIFVLLACFYSQIANLEWAVSSKSSSVLNGGDRSSRTIIDRNGDLYVMSQYQGSGPKTTVSFYDKQNSVRGSALSLTEGGVILTKFHSSGRFLWATTMDGSAGEGISWDSSTPMAIDSANNLYVAI